MVAVLGFVVPANAVGPEVVLPEVAQRIVAGAAAGQQFESGNKLEIACSAALPDGGAITFVRHKRGPVLLGIINDKPLKDLRREFTLNPRMADWGLIMDRNRDGRIDQLAFNIGLLPTEPAAGSANLPKVTGGRIHGSGENLGLVMANMKRAFWQAIDADFDGVADFHAFPAERRDNGWHRGWAVLGARDETCRMIGRDGEDAGGCIPGADRQIDGEQVTARRWAVRPELIFAWMDNAARQCRLGAADLPG